MKIAEIRQRQTLVTDEVLCKLISDWILHPFIAKHRHNAQNMTIGCQTQAIKHKAMMQ